MRHLGWVSYLQLSAEERYALAAMRARNHSVTETAAELGRHRSTIYREVKRNDAKHDGAFRPTLAVEMASGRRRRREESGPQAISGRPRLEGVGVMSHETIYFHIWGNADVGTAPSQNVRAESCRFVDSCRVKARGQ